MAKIAPSIAADITFTDVLHWSICVYCETDDTPKCEECLGTDLEPIPWAELFPNGRKEYGPCGGPWLYREERGLTST
jgi:hypothetical protein